MGLDSVELVMEFERRFQLTIPNEDAASLMTTRDVIDYVHNRVGDRPWTPCPTQKTFHRFRRALNGGELRIRPATLLDDVLPRAGRRGVWALLPSATGMTVWPALSRPSSISFAAWLLTLLLAAGIGVAAKSVLVGLLSALAIGVLTFRATMPLAKDFPANMTTTGDLVRWVAEQNLPPAAGGWKREAVRANVRAVVREQLGLDDTFSDDASFVHDLGIE